MTKVSIHSYFSDYLTSIVVRTQKEQTNAIRCLVLKRGTKRGNRRSRNLSSTRGLAPSTVCTPASPAPFVPARAEILLTACVRRMVLCSSVLTNLARKRRRYMPRDGCLATRVFAESQKYPPLHHSLTEKTVGGITPHRAEGEKSTKNSAFLWVHYAFMHLIYA